MLFYNKKGKNREKLYFLAGMKGIDFLAIIW
jgi:hypothetical protein